MTDCSTISKDWVDVLSALSIPTIAILGAYIAWQQWRTNRNRLKFDLFEKRYVLFENIKKFIANILTSGMVEQGSEIQFLRDTKSATFLFDDDVVKLTEEIYLNAIKLQTLGKTEKGSTQEQLIKNLEKQNKIKEWFGDQIKDIDKVFKTYLKIEH